MKTRILQSLTPAAVLAAARRITRAYRLDRARRRCPAFEFDERAARTFLARSLRRPCSDLPYDGEDWTLRPGWDLQNLCADETSDVESLVYYAKNARVITCTREDVDIDLILETPLGGDWMYQWRISFPSGARFAICNAGREEYRRLGWHDDERTPKTKGCRTATAVLREAVEYGNHLLFAYALAGGRIPAPRRPPRGISR